MKVTKEYIEYLKDNPEGYWFKSKLYGYGWTPAKPIGWAIMGVYILFLLGLIWYSENSGMSEVSPEKMLAIIAGATILLIIIIWRTGEPLKWQWGKDESKS